MVEFEFWENVYLPQLFMSHVFTLTDASASPSSHSARKLQLIFEDTPGNLLPLTYVRT